jgi:hypothetical protein
MVLVVTLPWSGGDSHSASEDIWAARPNTRIEDERAERRAAAMAEESQQQRVQQAARIRADAWCPEDGCSKSILSHGCNYFHSLGTQLDSHGSKSNIQTDIYPCPVEDWYRAQPGKGCRNFGCRKVRRMLRRTPILSFARAPNVDVPNLERGSGLDITWNVTWTRMREAWSYRSLFASTSASSASTLVARSRASACFLSSTRDNTWRESSRVVRVD